MPSWPPADGRAASSQRVSAPGPLELITAGGLTSIGLVLCLLALGEVESTGTATAVLPVEAITGVLLLASGVLVGLRATSTARNARTLRERGHRVLAAVRSVDLIGGADFPASVQVALSAPVPDSGAEVEHVLLYICRCGACAALTAGTSRVPVVIDHESGAFLLVGRHR